MASDQQLSISGSVIQRSLIPGDLGMVLNIATVPLAELRVDKEASEQELLRGLIAGILGIPRQSVLDDKQYQNLKGQLADVHSWEDWLDPRHLRHPFYYEFYYQTARALEAKMQAQESSRASLATDSLCLMASPVPQIQPFDVFLSVGFPLDRETNSPMRRLGLSSESFQLGLASMLAGLSPEERVAKFTDDAQSYEIPSGQSPQIKSESLLKLIETSGFVARILNPCFERVVIQQP